MNFSLRAAKVRSNIADSFSLLNNLIFRLLYDTINIVISIKRTLRWCSTTLRILWLIIKKFPLNFQFLFFLLLFGLSYRSLLRCLILLLLFLLLFLIFLTSIGSLTTSILCWCLAVRPIFISLE